MKNTFFLCIIMVMVFSCNTSKKTSTPENKTIQVKKGDTVRLSSDKQEYEVIIIEPGFGSFLVSRAQPKGYYSQNYMEMRNFRYVQEWNSRVLQPGRFDSNLYEMNINYRQDIDYGYDVNYKLYNYFLFFQNRYNQNLLGGRIPQN